jgi:acetolactate synthase I/II/III large subunit
VQPEGAIVVDEAVTVSLHYAEPSAGAARHTQLAVPGGSIGGGPPCAVGAAVACPDRPVIDFQADGSAAYTLQALWTQARESLDVTTVICANRSYRILQVELHRGGAQEFGPAAAGLTDLGRPALDWVRLAEGQGVPGTRAETAEELIARLRAAFAEPGPHLVQALL